MSIDVRFKKLHPNAVIPSYANEGDAGMDMTAVAINITPDYIEYETGLSMEIPEGCVGLIFPRSSNSKKDLLLCNSVGIIDSGYRGPINFRYKRTKEKNPKIYELGDRVGQIIILPYPKVVLSEVEELITTDRGESGFGSTGK